METAIVILNWNGRHLLERFLPSVINSSKHIATVYIADNASTDGSVAFCNKQFPEIKLLKNTKNLGYAGGYNWALKQIEADLFVLLNSDVQTPLNWLQPVIKLFDNDPKLGAAQPKILDLHKTDYFEYAGAAGGFIDRLGYPYCRGRIFNNCERDVGQYDQSIEIDWASGACLFVRSDVFRQVEGFDTAYFAHQEEIDLCWRISSLGYKIMSSGKSHVFHLGGGTLSSSNPKKTFYNFRNSLFNLIKNKKSPTHFLSIIQRLFLDGIAALFFIFQFKFLHFFAILRAHFSFYYYLPLMIKKRRHTKKRFLQNNLRSIVYSYYIKGIKKYADLK